MPLVQTCFRLLHAPVCSQVLAGAQVYEQQKATYDEINECMSLWKMRHLEVMTANDTAQSPVSFWLRRREPFGPMTANAGAYSYKYHKEENGVYSFNSDQIGDIAIKTELQRTWKRLQIGEGKAETHNNMINVLMGEVRSICYGVVLDLPPPPPPLRTLIRPAPCAPLDMRGPPAAMIGATDANAASLCLPCLEHATGREGCVCSSCGGCGARSRIRIPDECP